MIRITKQISKTEFTAVSQQLLQLQTGSIFFDIETTGFSANSSIVYLIGCIYYDGSTYQLIQWFAQSPDTELQVLKSFFEFLSSFDTLIHYNGEGFDLPFLLKRFDHYDLPYDFTTFQSIDLYKLLLPYKNILKLSNLKQKTVEGFLGIEREDLYHGGELISVYHDFIKNLKTESQDLLLLHNHDDLLGMVRLYPVIAYYHLFHGEIFNASCHMHTYPSAKGQILEEAVFSFSCKMPIPREFSYRQQDFYLTVNGQSGKLSVQVYTDELKYFFPNYKDYYYLPMEDISIHKSVALYVDKDFRTQATAANCYNKKSGCFLPQIREIITPYFKQNYKDKQTYFELTEEFLNDSKQMESYVKHILACLK